ncbi:MAG: aconitate hydratase AcnA [bacterium]|nr:aconitate hydratase AcnA [Betaproteobacteria bacterium]
MLTLDGRAYRYYSLAAAGATAGLPVQRLPYCLKSLLENALRQVDMRPEARADARDAFETIDTLRAYLEHPAPSGELSFLPQRVMMDDTAGLPLLGDLAAMRDAAVRAGFAPQTIEPQRPIDFVVDHSIIAEFAGRADAHALNARREHETNQERFRFLRWAAQAFRNLRIVPPGGGICHQINLEHLATVVQTVDPEGSGDPGDAPWLVPDSMVGIDSHTPMINALGIVGWGVSGIEGLGAALGETVSLPLPRVIGLHLTGRLRPGITATDLVLTVTQRLRQHDCIGAFIECFGPGLTHLSVPARATVANMAPECGTTMNYFPIDAQTVHYLRQTGRDAAHVARVEGYAKAQGLWHDPDAARAQYSEILTLDLASVEPSLAGPGQPHHRVGLPAVADAFHRAGTRPRAVRLATAAPSPSQSPIQDGDLVIAAITSCTNTSNPANMIGAGLLARNALARGLRSKPWVKTSLSPGSRVVAHYLVQSGLQQSLDGLGFHLTGFGCMTCVGFSGSLPAPIEAAIDIHGIATAAVVSGNRNYDGRIHAKVHASFLASPPLVVAYALAGTVRIDLSTQPIGHDPQGEPVYLRELWPDPDDIERIAGDTLEPGLFRRTYASLYEGTPDWQQLPYPRGARFPWQEDSVFIRPPPEFDRFDEAFDGERERTQPARIEKVRILAIYGDNVTTEHVSPMGPIPADSLAAGYLAAQGVATPALGTYAARRLVPQVMARGTYSSPHLHNRMTPDAPGGFTLHQPGGERLTIFEAAERYRAAQIPLVVIAGRNYGTGSSRDWSAKGPRELGVRAILAASFERLHRANLVAAGVLPLQFDDPDAGAALTGNETLVLEGLDRLSTPRAVVTCIVRGYDGRLSTLHLIAALHTRREVSQFAAGGLYRYSFDLRVRAGRHR